MTHCSPHPHHVEPRQVEERKAGGPEGKAGEVPWDPGGRRLRSSTHLPGPGREEAPRGVGEPLWDAGVAQPVHQPLVEQVGLVCRGGDRAEGSR